MLILVWVLIFAALWLFVQIVPYLFLAVIAILGTICHVLWLIVTLPLRPFQWAQAHRLAREEAVRTHGDRVRQKRDEIQRLRKQIAESKSQLAKTKTALKHNQRVEESER